MQINAPIHTGSNRADTDSPLGRTGQSLQCAMLGLLLCVSSVNAHAEAGDPQVDELIVTATKQATALQNTPLALSLFDAGRLDDARIDQALELQVAVPNMLLSNEQFSLSQLTIRGIGRNAVGVSADSGTAIHYDGAYLQYSTLIESEFYDLERIEVLRGPQGTLYGRNTTAGVINLLPARASDEWDAAINIGLGTYDSRGLRGYLNVPVSDTVAVRIAGMSHRQDGFTRNERTDNRVDDRDLWSARLSLAWRPSNTTEIHLSAQRYHEDSTRMRTHKQSCVADERPFPFNQGCLPGQPVDAVGVPNSQGTLSGLLPSLVDLSGGAIPGGLYLLTPGENAFAGAHVPTDLRRVYADFDPRLQVDEDLLVLNFQHQRGVLTYEAVTSYQQIEYRGSTDFDWAVPTLRFTPNIPGLTDAEGRLSTPQDPSVSGFPFLRQTETSAYEADTLTLETRVRSSYDGPWNFLAGFFLLDHVTRDTHYDVHSNGLAFAAPIDFVDGAPISFFRSDARRYDLDTWALFGELYYDVRPDRRLTLGLRYTEEQKRLQDRQTLLNTPGLPEVPGVSNRPFLTGTFEDAFTGFGITDPRFHGFGTTNSVDEFNNPVPSYSRRSDDWSAVTGQIGIDQDLELGWTDRTLVYALLSRSYKSGGLNPASETDAFDDSFKPEYINAFELGSRNVLGAGREAGAAQLNLAWFFYDYEDLQVTRIIDRTSVNENVDARIQGLEVELDLPLFAGFRLDLAGAWLHSRIRGGQSMDPANPTAGDPNWTLVKNTSGDAYIMPTPGSGLMFDTADCESRLSCASVFTVNPTSPTNPDADGANTPAVLIPIGVNQSLSGNALPNAPSYSVNLGLSWAYTLPAGHRIQPRIEYYRQDAFYFRIYNSRQDRIDGWDRVNLSLSLSDRNDQWSVQAYVKNLSNKNHITGAFVADATVGGYTNLFLLDPRTIGLRLNYRL
jgi:iron complex outermembrane recepter protein